MTTRRALQSQMECLRDCAGQLEALAREAAPAYHNSLQVAADNTRVSAKYIEIVLRLMDKAEGELNRIAA